MCGAIEHQLPFELPSGEKNPLDDPYPSRNSSQDSSFKLSSGDLREMESIYQNTISEYQSLLSLYNMEKERARKQGKLRMFPKTLSQWRPEGSLYPESQINAVYKELPAEAILYQQYSLESKQHSRSYLYISMEHQNKRPSVVHYSSPCLASSQEIKELHFGIVERLFQHSFADRSFMWAAVSLYKEPKFDSGCGLWCAENIMGRRILKLLDGLSHPLTIAIDSKVWFLDVYP